MGVNNEMVVTNVALKPTCHPSTENRKKPTLQKVSSPT